MKVSTLVLAALALPAALAKRALLIIDVQNCFTSGGSLAVPDGDAVIPVINSLRERSGNFFDMVVLSKDWHPEGHISFASAHDAQTGDVIDLYCNEQECCPVSEEACECNGCTEVPQMLWPDHCVQNTYGAEIREGLVLEESDVTVLKGYLQNVDSYSAFLDNNKAHMTELDQVLSDAGVTDIYVAGLALDYCVKFTALDGKALGYNTYVIVDAARGVTEETVEQGLKELKLAKVGLVHSSEIPCAPDFLEGSEGQSCPNA